MGRNAGRSTGAGGAASAWRRRVARAVHVLLAAVSVAILTVTGYAWVQYRSLNGGLHRSPAWAGRPASVHGDTNLLIMGLDSRLDENGDPLPADIYNALHAGDAASGGENANVLMLVHVPGDGSRATSISIPRDDYVDLAGCPDGQCRGKIKEAYGLAFDAESRRLAGQSGLTSAQKVQTERDAGRRAEIATVSQFLGGVSIDHFVEVTLVAFFQIAQVVQPITVCLNEATQNSYSGANFHAGTQQIDAQQAVAFVRQRRDYVHPELNFTDLDRERRQQAFIASLAYQLKQAGTLANPAKLQGILDVAKQNIAVDSGLDLISLAHQAANLTGGDVTFVTVPVDHFGKDPAGEDVNIVNVPAVQALVHRLLTATPAGPPPASPSAGDTPHATVDVLNGSGRTGLAAGVAHDLVTRGYSAGSVGNDTRVDTRTVVRYGAGGPGAATALAELLGGASTVVDSSVPAGHLRVILGTGFAVPPSLASASVQPAPTASPATTSDNAGTDAGTLSPLTGGRIPCVK